MGILVSTFTYWPARVKKKCSVHRVAECEPHKKGILLGTEAEIVSVKSVSRGCSIGSIRRAAIRVGLKLSIVQAVRLEAWTAASCALAGVRQLPPLSSKLLRGVILGPLPDKLMAFC